MVVVLVLVLVAVVLVLVAAAVVVLVVVVVVTTRHVLTDCRQSLEGSAPGPQPPARTRVTT
jgi:hypothetical protein